MTRGFFDFAVFAPLKVQMTTIRVLDEKVT